MVCYGQNLLGEMCLCPCASNITVLIFSSLTGHRPGRGPLFSCCLCNSRPTSLPTCYCRSNDDKQRLAGDTISEKMGVLFRGYPFWVGSKRKGKGKKAPGESQDPRAGARVGSLVWIYGLRLLQVGSTRTKRKTTFVGGSPIYS